MNLLSDLLQAAIAIAVLCCLYGFYRTWKTGVQPEFGRFQAGAALSMPAEGPYSGRADELGQISWKGKTLSAAGKGINAFEKNGVKTEVYPFIYSVSPSIGFPGKNVIRLDYNQPGNPFWLRFIVDEMVEEAPGKYLGVVYITLIPGTPFRMGYFTLERSA